MNNNKNKKIDKCSNIILQFTKEDFLLLYDLVCDGINDFLLSEKHFHIYSSLTYIVKQIKEKEEN